MPTTKPIVLLVDDDENLLHSLARSLRRQPYQTLTARTASEAIWILMTNDVDVLVTDEQMPGMSGGDLLAWAVTNSPETMRIVLTGHATAAMAIRAINEGQAYHFFTKPCDPVQLAIMIRKAMEHRSLLRERQRLLDASQHQHDDLKQFERNLAHLQRLLSQELEGPLSETAQCGQTLAEQYPDHFDLRARELLQTALEGVGQMRQAVHTLVTSIPTVPAVAAPSAPSPDELSTSETEQGL